ncbi:MAG: hypothetical protein ACJAZC_000210 [Cryomorphaceae bacterium]|jgi:hypothetical protein
MKQSTIKTIIMKRITLFLSLFAFSFCYSQSLPINFEGDVATDDFVDFDGGVATVLANPLAAGINTSETVAQIVRDGGAIFAGSKISLAANLDFSVQTVLSMKVYTTAPVGTVVKFKLEGMGSSEEVDAFTTTSEEWETLEWIFAGTSNDLNEVVFMFDFGNLGDGSTNSSFYFDDVEQISGPAAPIPATLPVDFESDVISSDFLNYSGAIATVIPNPQMDGINTSSTVCQVVKDGGEFWAVSKLLLADNLDLSTMWNISMKVYTTAPIGTRIKLELAGSQGQYNLDYLTTGSGEWEIASWNFDNQTNDFDEINISFDFGNVGDSSSTSTFLFDDLEQFAGPALPDPIAATLPVSFEDNVVTTDFINEDGGFAAVIPNPFIDTDNSSATVGQFVRSGGAPWAKSKLVLTDFLQNMTTNGFFSMKVYTDAPVGTLLKFKIESTDAGFADERDQFTTVSGGWATYTWDFTNGDSPIYNVVTLMLGYATPNNASANATFLFDDIQQTTGPTGLNELSKLEGVHIFPNPANDRLIISSENDPIQSITLFDILGNEVLVLQPNRRNVTIEVAGLTNGMYIAKISTSTQVGSMKLMIQ